MTNTNPDLRFARPNGPFPWDEILVCSACRMLIAYDDSSGAEDEEALRAAFIERWTGYWLVMLDSEGPDDEDHLRSFDHGLECQGCGDEAPGRLWEAVAELL